MRRILVNRDGSAAVEFAASSFALVATFVMLLEASTMFFAQGVLEAAVDRAARFAITGAEPAGMTREERLMELVASMSMGMIDTTGVQIQTAAYSSYLAVGTTGAGTAGLGDGDQVLKVEAALTWPGLTPLLQTVVGTVQLDASAVVRNESF
jgi:Flp pilus assembly protein TadG